MAYDEDMLISHANALKAIEPIHKVLVRRLVDSEKRLAEAERLLDEWAVYDAGNNHDLLLATRKFLEEGQK